MKEITAVEFEQEVLQGGRVILDFYSSECPPCEAVAPKFEALAALYGKKIKFLKIFRQQNRELATELGVSSSPTLLFFDEGKQFTTSLTGGIKKAEIQKRLDMMISAEEVKEIKSNQKSIVTEYDVAILGGGPAGLTAGIYLGQAKIKTVLIDPALPGGYMGITHKVSNYPGFTEPQPGYMLAHYMSEQAKGSGIDFKVAVDISSVDLEKKEILIDKLETIRARKIVIATGTSPNPMNIPGEKEYRGKGISYCATCDAKYYEGKGVVVIGGGNSALEESLYIVKFAKTVTIVHRSEKFKANEIAIEKVLSHPKINILFGHHPRSFVRQGEKMITTIENMKSKEVSTLVSDGIFVFIGLKSNVEVFGDSLPETDKWGYLITDEDMKTSIPDVFAIGDITSKKYRQITTAVADGTIAAIAISTELLN